MSAAEIEQAKRNAATARARIDTDLGALQQRLNPKTMAQDAWSGVVEKTDTLTDQAVETARRKPALAAGAVAATLLLVFRKPVGRGLKRLFRRKDRETRPKARARVKADGRSARGAAQPEAAPSDDRIPHIPADTAASHRTGASNGH